MPADPKPVVSVLHPVPHVSSPHTKCRVCNHRLDVTPWLNLGSQPLANNLLDSPSTQYPVVPLEVVSCPSCGLSQLTHTANPATLFSNYLYTPSQSETFRRHFGSLATDIALRYRSHTGTPLAVDIGSNDGLFLSYLKSAGWEVQGVEPAVNLATEADSRGIPTIGAFWAPSIAQYIRQSKGPASVITATNVFAHIDDLNAVLEGVRVLLEPANGRFIIEFPYLLNMLQDGTFDLVYHEHLTYWTLNPLRLLLGKWGLTITAVEEIPVHGGSLRVTAMVTGNSHPERGTLAYLYGETHLLSMITAFQPKVDTALTAFREAVQDNTGSIAGYTAPAKATVLLNAAGIGGELLPMVVEDSVLKQGRWIPVHGKAPIKVVAPSSDHPHTYALFAWNLEEDIVRRLQGAMTPALQRLLIPFPRVHYRYLFPQAAVDSSVPPPLD